MRHENGVEAKAETHALGLWALLYYAATLAAMLICGYSLLALVLRTVGRDFAVMLNPAGM